MYETTFSRSEGRPNNAYLDSPVKKKIWILVPPLPKRRFSLSVLQCGDGNDVELNGADCKRISGLS